jgi:hypothetical protein
VSTAEQQVKKRGHAMDRPNGRVDHAAVLFDRRGVLQMGAGMSLASASAAAPLPAAGVAPKRAALPDAKAMQAALAQFERVVGSEWVFSKKEDLHLYRDYYSPFWGEPEERVCSAAVAPSSVEEVQAIARTANKYRIPLYPISTGRNLGYGGSAPALSGSVVLDLKRMNRIIEVDEANAFALVEPGVSYIDLSNYIREKGLKLWLDCPAPGWGSPIGNSLDHGAGFTRVDFRNHFESHCGMEVVLANGDLVRTGMGAMLGAKTWQQYRSGFGPMVDGLFLQSNFGIVTKMGFWLMPEPEALMSGEIYVPRYRDIIPLTELISRLENGRIFTGMPEFGAPLLGIPTGQGLTVPPPVHPDVQKLMDTDDIDIAKLEAIGARIGTAYWSARLTFYGPMEVMEAQWRHAQQVLSAIPGVQFKDGVRRRFPLTQTQINDVSDWNTIGIATIKDFDLQRMTEDGGVGHVLFSAIIPRTGEAVIEANDVFRDTFKKLGLRPQPLFWPTAYLERSYVIILGFKVTRDPEVNKKTRAHIEALIEVAAKRGWGEYRSSPAFFDHVMDTYSFNNHAHRRLCETLKDATDPNGILSAGRYGIWPAHLRVLR